MKQIIYAIAFLLITLGVSASQTEDTLQNNKIDSAKSELLNQNTQILKTVDSLRAADSLAKLVLQKEIESLKTTDLLKKEELQKKLNDMSKADSLKKAMHRRAIDSLKALTKGYPVIPFRDTLFVVYSRLGPFSAKDRANSIMLKIRKLADDPGFNSDSMKIYPGEQSYDIMYNEIIVLSITDSDALWLNSRKEDVANQYLETVKTAINVNIEENSLKNILLNIGYAVLTILGLVLIIKYLNKLFLFITNRIETRKEDVFKGLKVKNYELLTPERQTNITFKILKVVKVILFIVIAYFFLTVLFGIFPATKGIAEILLGYVLNPLKKMGSALVKYIPNLLTIIVIVFVTRYIIKFVKFLMYELESGSLTIKGFYHDWAKPTFNIVRFLIYAFMFIVIFPYLPGSDSPIFQGVTVLLGIVFSLGSTTAVANIVAGIVITYMRPFKIGDRVKVGDVIGDIIEKNMLVTRLRTIKNEDITIPNSTIMSKHTTNYSTSAEERGLIMHTTVTIGYDVPWKTVHELLINAAKSTNGILQSPEPFVLQLSLDDWYVSYQINAYTNEPNKQAVIYSELHKNIQDKFNETGVEIMSPHYQTLRDGNQTTIPENYLKKDYAPPSFRVKDTNKEGKQV